MGRSCRRWSWLAVAIATATAGSGVESSLAWGRAEPRAGKAAAKSGSSQKGAKAKAPVRSPEAKECLAALDALGVAYEVAGPHKGIDIPVKATGTIGGVVYDTWQERDLILDCSLVYSLHHAGAYMRDVGITKVMYTSSYQRRNIAGTTRLSSHSFGLALDVHDFSGDGIERVTIKDHFELGLGWNQDCIGEPLSEEGAMLKLVLCRMERSQLFRLILGPDSDPQHYNHFHVEALPWKKRADGFRRAPQAHR